MTSFEAVFKILSIFQKSSSTPQNNLDAYEFLSKNTYVNRSIWVVQEFMFTSKEMMNPPPPDKLCFACSKFIGRHVKVIWSKSHASLKYFFSWASQIKSTPHLCIMDLWALWHFITVNLTMIMLKENYAYSLDDSKQRRSLVCTHSDETN